MGLYAVDRKVECRFRTARNAAGRNLLGDKALSVTSDFTIVPLLRRRIENHKFTLARQATVFARTADGDSVRVDFVNNLLVIWIHHITTSRDGSR